MTSYILKNNKKSKDILLFEEKKSYSFTPKKTYKWVKKITILDTEMLSEVWENKINKEYDKLLKLIYSLISEEDTTSGDVLIAYTEIERNNRKIFKKAIYIRIRIKKSSCYGTY